MKNFTAFEEVAKKRSNETGEDLENILDTAKTMIFAKVDNARIYAYCKTGQWSSKRATQAWHDAIVEFNQTVRGH